MMSLIAGKVGSKVLSIAALVLAVGLISYFVIQYIQEGEKDKIVIELQEETNDRRKAIRDAINQSPRPTARPSSPSSRGSTSSVPDSGESSGMQYFRERQGR